MGDVHRLIKAKDKKFSDPEVESLLRMNPNKLPHKLNPSYIRPAYAYTKASVGGINQCHTELMTN